MVISLSFVISGNCACIITFWILCHHMYSSLIMFAQFLLITNQQSKSSPISVWTPLCAESKISLDLLLTQFYLSNRWSKQLLSNTNVVDLFFLYNFYFGQISSCCAKILVLDAPQLNMFCPETRRFRVWKLEVPVLLCFTYSGAHTGDCAASDTTRHRADVRTAA